MDTALWIGCLPGAIVSRWGIFMEMLHDYRQDMAYRRFMPPLTGTPEEINALGDYLYAQASPADTKLKAQK